MKRTAVMLSMTLAVGLIGDHVLHAQQTADMEQVKAANQAFYEALSARDIKRMEQIWSHEPHVRAIPPASKEVLSGWEAVRKHWDEAFARSPEQVSVSMQDAQVRVDHNVAWIVGAEQIQARPVGGEVVTWTGLATNVFEKQGGTWLMVHHHASRPPTP